MYVHQCINITNPRDSSVAQLYVYIRVEDHPSSCMDGYTPRPTCVGQGQNGVPASRYIADGVAHPEQHHTLTMCSGLCSVL
jgi:hypothetical protein